MATKVTEYAWSSGSACRADATAVGEWLESLSEKHGELTPEVVVKGARVKSSPLHGFFEWDDTVAANKWRLDQASYVLRHIQVIYERADDEYITVRAFVPVSKEEDAPKTYRSIGEVLADPVMRAAHLDTAKRELESYKSRWKHLSEVVSLITRVERDWPKV